MMFIITEIEPCDAADYLVEHTNKNFVFKQVLELAQLICSCGYSDIYKPVKQGKELQEWIKENSGWVATYFEQLLYGYVYEHISMKPKTFSDLKGIKNSICLGQDYIEPKTAIFRYKKGYECKYETNSILPIDECCKQYRLYLDWKFRKDKVA